MNRQCGKAVRIAEKLRAEDEISPSRTLGVIVWRSGLARASSQVVSKIKRMQGAKNTNNITRFLTRVIGEAHGHMAWGTLHPMNPPAVLNSFRTLQCFVKAQTGEGISWDHCECTAGGWTWNEEDIHPAVSFSDHF